MRKIRRNCHDKTAYVEAYTETDLAKDFAKQSSFTLVQSKMIIAKILEILSDAIIENEAIKLSRLFKAVKSISNSTIHYHSPEDFKKLKRGEIKNLKEIPAKTKQTSFFKMHFTMANELRKKLRNSRKEKKVD
jgi:hypothetical protein